MKLSEIVAASERGEVIESRYKSDRVWRIKDNFVYWHVTAFEYRIKPNPLEMWVNVCSDGSMYAYETKELAALDCKTGDRTVNMREVAE